MQFKVGDRVEVVEPAECVEEPNNRLGTGTILDADDREYFYVKVDSNTKPWWYAERCLRALPAPTPTLRGPQEKTLSERILEAVDTDWNERHVRKWLEKHKSIKSITVGTQVRLTGVVTSAPSERDGAVAVQIGGAAGPADTVFVFPEALEVIRQPFKRGEVVYHVGDKDSEPRTVVQDEAEGHILVARHLPGSTVLEWEAKDFERRPSRPKEER